MKMKSELPLGDLRMNYDHHESELTEGISTGQADLG